jgi:hypothetical protein
MNSFQQWLTEACDPYPFLKRSLCSAQVASHFKADRRHKIHHILYKIRPNIKEPTAKQALDRILANLRMFSEEISSKPPRSISIIGIGFRWVDAGEWDEVSATYISTQYFMIWIPVYPIRSYVMEAGKEPRTRASVPLSLGQRKRQKYVKIALFFLLLCGLMALVVRMVDHRKRSLFFTNGLDIPVDVQVDDRWIRVPPDSIVVDENTRRGTHHVRALTQQGVVIGDQEIEIGWFSQFTMYNIMGVAPVYRDNIIYSTKSQTLPQGPRPSEEIEYLIVNPWIVREKVFYPFKEPDKRWYIEKGTSVSFRHVGMANGGWQTTLRILERTNRSEQAEQLFEKIAQLEPDEPSVAIYISKHYFEPEKRKRGEQLLGPIVQGSVNRVEAHQHWQDLRIAMGKRDLIREHYQQLYLNDPQNGNLAYYYLRTRTGKERKVEWNKIVSKFPDNHYVQSFYLSALMLEGEFEKCETLAAKEASVDSPRQSMAEVAYVKSLMGQHKEQVAIQELATWMDGHPSKIDFELAILYAQISRLSAGELPRPSDYYWKSLNIREESKSLQSLPYAVFAVRSLHPDYTFPSHHDNEKNEFEDHVWKQLKLKYFARFDLDGSLSLLKKATESELKLANPEIIAALCAELVNRGQPDVAHSVFNKLVFYDPYQQAAWKELVFENKTEQIHFLMDDSVSSKLFAMLIQIRREKDKTKRKSMVDLAQTLDVLGSEVSLMLKNWK